MKFYLPQNVFDAALERVRWLFDEFPDVIVNFSGGKDSTAVLNLALRVAEEKGRLPVPVMFIDQEAEWQTVIDYVRDVMHDPRVQPFWLQVPFRIFNATSPTDQWLHCWEPGKKWIREREPDSLHENVYGTDRFMELFPAFLRHHFAGRKACFLTGVRCEESPARTKGLTSYEVYKGVTWGRKVNPKLWHFSFSPLYDWGVTDVWKAIHANGWRYCRIYDFMYQHGVPVHDMRVSNIHHETAIKILFYVHEIEADTWNRVTERLSGINTVGHLREDFFVPKELPRAFRSWIEYRDYLLEHLITDPENRARLRKLFASYDDRFDPEVRSKLTRVEIQSILANDFHGTKLKVFQAAHISYSYNAGKLGGISAEYRRKRIAKKLAAKRASREAAVA